ncbi:uncharacterized protein BYT42DRAFT_394258 [Radiomyces spectabilis]|uniref:uncharacterized protein n=1 Tax=Radiomyces spectabilis TaxID=64574 RepID=UPI00221F1C85|nr:uncharacterized protein BYT42DRAFT_394258 [Radiomyces spectabilis]KAI8374193.1 hypothetical protein BYT42DRAFT_394258 [Radiomyces spectabilis]
MRALSCGFLLFGCADRGVVAFHWGSCIRYETASERTNLQTLACYGLNCLVYHHFELAYIKRMGRNQQAGVRQSLEMVSIGRSRMKKTSNIQIAWKVVMKNQWKKSIRHRSPSHGAFVHFATDPFLRPSFFSFYFFSFFSLLTLHSPNPFLSKCLIKEQDSKL